MFLHSWFPLIWYAIWHCSEKDEFWPIDPIFRVVREGRSADKWFDTMLLHSWFSLIWYATWACSNNVEFWPFEPKPRVRDRGGLQAKYLLQIFATLLLHSWFSLIWYATWPCAEKFEFLPTDPIPRLGGGGVWGRIFATMLLHLLICFNLICNKTNSTNLYPPTKGYLRETCKSQNINPIYLTLSSPSVSFRS